jgi:isopenicillin N synthase-like dioxygenase
MADIPLIDFGLFLKGDEKEKQKAAEDIDDAFRNLGFVYLKNHGVPKEMVEECFAWSKKFFDLPLETKMLAPHPPDASHHRGYSAIGVEKVAGKEVEGLDDEEVNKLPEVSHPPRPLLTLFPPPS